MAGAPSKDGTVDLVLSVPLAILDCADSSTNTETEDSDAGRELHIVDEIIAEANQALYE